MDLFDHSPLRRDDPRAVELHSLLIQAYDDEVEALALAGQVGLLKADIERYPKLRFTWWSILEEAVREGQLRRLVETALGDPMIANWHPKIRLVLEAESGPVPPKPRRRRTATTAAERRASAQRPTVGSKAKLWKPGTTLRVRFMDGAETLHKKVESAAQQWLEYANLKFDIGDDPEAEIRVSFKLEGSWSYLGTDGLTVGPDKPTVNFGWLTPSTPMREVNRVVLHEFGHVLGLQHEHGNPASTIKWNRPKVYEAYQGPPNNWSRATVDNVIFAIWPPGYFPVHKVFDPDSIMMFPQSAEFLQGGMEIGWNMELSPVDKQFAAALYRQGAR